MDLQEINNLVDDPASVSLPIRLGALLILFLLILFLGYKLLIVDKQEQLVSVQSKEESLRSTFELKARKASQLPVYKKQLDEMRYSFGTLVRQLPGKTEIPGLILDISEKGLSNGLDIELFEPRSEVLKEFFATKPITLRARGGYDELASFVSDISGLSRIVTIHDIELLPAKEDGDDRLVMDAVIKTYRYIEEGDDQNG